MAIQANVLLPEVSRPVLAFPSAAPSTSVSTYINTANYDVISFVIQVTNDGTGGTSAITLKQATSATGTAVKALAFTQYYANLSSTTSVASPSGDTLTYTAATSNTFSTATTASSNQLYVIDVNAASLDVTNGFHYVAVAMGTQSHATITVLALARAERYGDKQVLSAL